MFCRLYKKKKKKEANRCKSYTHTHKKHNSFLPIFFIRFSFISYYPALYRRAKNVIIWHTHSMKDQSSDFRKKKAARSWREFGVRIQDGQSVVEKKKYISETKECCVVPLSSSLISMSFLMWWTNGLKMGLFWFGMVRVQKCLKHEQWSNR